MLKNTTNLFYVSNDNQLEIARNYFNQKNFNTSNLNTTYENLRSKLPHNAKLILRGYYNESVNDYMIEITYLSKINKLESLVMLPLTRQSHIKYPYNLI